MFISIVILGYIYLCLVDYIDKKKEENKRSGAEEYQGNVSEEDRGDIWDHPLLVMNGIEKPVGYGMEECQAIVVRSTDVDCPLQWKVDYKGDNERREYETIDITDYQLKNKRLVIRN